MLPGSKYTGVPRRAKFLGESGELALFSGETAADVAYNRTQENAEPRYFRNSLFARLRRASGETEWRLLLTTGVDFRIADVEDEWRAAQGRWLKECFEVFRASFAPDGRHLWLVCNTHSCTYTVVCCYDMASGTTEIRQLCSRTARFMSKTRRRIFRTRKATRLARRGMTNGLRPTAGLSERQNPDSKHHGDSPRMFGG